jgi:hypothetical protein
MAGLDPAIRVADTAHGGMDHRVTPGDDDAK